MTYYSYYEHDKHGNWDKEKATFPKNNGSLYHAFKGTLARDLLLL